MKTIEELLITKDEDLTETDRKIKHRIIEELEDKRQEEEAEHFMSFYGG